MTGMGEVRYIKKYGITVAEDGYYDYRGVYRKLYNIYTADGCCWEKGMSYRGVIAECKQYGETFRQIYKAMGKGAIRYEC